MKCNEVSELLVDLNEGTIIPGDRKLVEEHLATCVHCTEDLALLRRAFETLRAAVDEDVPTHYFTNMVPRVRQRIEERPGKWIVFGLPGWIQRIAAPFSAIAVVVSLVSLYTLLNPAYETMQSHLEQIVSEFGGEDIDGVTEMVTTSPVLARGTELNRSMLETFPSITLVSRHIDRELAEDEVAHGHRLTTFLAADNSSEDITDEEVESVINRLNETTL